MSERTLFVADTHLVPGEGERHRRFIDFLRDADGARHVFLLGDVFDYWMGPRHLDLEDYRVVLAGLRELTRAGMRISFVPGNRDYLIEKRFSSETGVELIGDDMELTLGDRRVYVAHGDFLYNKNPKYTAYRRMLRFDMLRSAFLNMPEAIGRGIIHGFRKVSVKTTPSVIWTSDDLLDGAERHFQRGVDVVICGHIHQPCHLSQNGRDLFILGDWSGSGEYVEFDGTDFRLKKAL